MDSMNIRSIARLIAILLLCSIFPLGCANMGPVAGPGAPPGDAHPETARAAHTTQDTRLVRDGVPGVPREFEKACLPEYQIEPPDILLIDAVKVVPKPPYKISALDSILVSCPNAFQSDPIGGQYPVDPDGTVNLGEAYGSVRVSGMTLQEAKAAIEKQLSAIINEPRVVVYLGHARGVQQVRGEHLVAPDGTVRLGVYGAVRVAGMTVPEAKVTIENFLSRYLESPEIALDVGGYNSKVYYIIFDGGGNGQQILRLPWTGNDTVLDAISQARGLPSISSTHQIWLARPALPNAPCDQVLPVDWQGITTAGRSATNYQILPGDRLYVKALSLITIDTALARFFNPIERILGFGLLGTGLYNSITYPRASATGGL